MQLPSKRTTDSLGSGINGVPHFHLPSFFSRNRNALTPLSLKNNSTITVCFAAAARSPMGDGRRTIASSPCLSVGRSIAATQRGRSKERVDGRTAFTQSLFFLVFSDDAHSTVFVVRSAAADGGKKTDAERRDATDRRTDGRRADGGGREPASGEAKCAQPSTRSIEPVSR